MGEEERVAELEADVAVIKVTLNFILWLQGMEVLVLLILLAIHSDALKDFLRLL